MDNIFYMAADGSDHWNGTRPTAAGTNDGPFRTMNGALRAIKRAGHKQARVELRGGTYPTRETVLITAADELAVTFAAYADEQPVIDGGCYLDAGQPARINGVDAIRFTVPEAAAKYGKIDQLFINGNRKQRSLLPKRDFYKTNEPESNKEQLFMHGTDRFLVRQEDFNSNWHDIGGIEAVIFHWWIEERMPVESYDAATGLVISSKTSNFGMWPQKTEYRLFNVLEALTEPGEYYYDRHEKAVYYLPEAGETIDNITAVVPAMGIFVLLNGDPHNGKYVNDIHFENLIFRHGGNGEPAVGQIFDFCDDAMPIIENAVGIKWIKTNEKPVASAQQASAHLPGLLMFNGARNCAVKNCTVEHCGWFGLALNFGCSNIEISGNEFNDLGGGGMRAGGANKTSEINLLTHHITITDNHLHHGGRLHHSAIGIGIYDAFGCLIEHNLIHDFYYTGISCGWVWGYGDNVTREIRIGHNHIYNIGLSTLSDLGGIYLLGVQSGTRIYNNRIHDITARNYGSTAIYLDEGSGHVIVEGNLAYDCDRHVFSMHYGREDIVRGNIFAFGGTHTMAFYDGTNNLGFGFPGINKTQSLTLLYNVNISDKESFFCLIPQAAQDGGLFTSDCNYFYRYGQTNQLLFCEMVHVNGAHVTFGGGKTFEEWQKLGWDQYSKFTDPGFMDLAKRDFRLRPDSPLRANPNFATFDPDNVGLIKEKN